MLDAVTGAFSFTGRAIARQLLAEGREVVTLVRRPGTGGGGSADPDRAVRLRRSGRPGRGVPRVDTFYNTYWIRFERGELTFDEVIRRTRLLLAAASQAGVRRVVHVSVVNAGPAAPTTYFTAKARLDDVVRGLGPVARHRAARH